MSMFCYQCQETLMNKGCTIKGVCGKQPKTAALEDLLVYTAKSVSAYSSLLDGHYVLDFDSHFWVVNSLFITLTNSNFDDEHITKEIIKGTKLRDELKKITISLNIHIPDKYLKFDEAFSDFSDEAHMIATAEKVGVLRTQDEDIRSLRETIIYGLKGMSAYIEHAHNLGYDEIDLYRFVEKILADVDSDSLSVDDLLNMLLDVGAKGVEAMALLDKANTSTYGSPEATNVSLNVKTNPAILISGHDLKDLEELLEQTKGTGVDVYTHSEMLPAHAYPFFKKYDNLVGNYGDSWWHQTSDFEKFNGPILFTSNCIVPPRGAVLSYKDKIFTTNSAGLEGATHIEKGEDGNKDFSQIIDLAKKCPSPISLEDGEITVGFAHNQILNHIETILEAINENKIKKFIVMGGCDARMKDRAYYTDFAKALPKDTIILTAGCAKYRYNKLNLGDIGGIPRVLDAGQCNDSYSLAYVALKLKEILNLNDINDLPIIFNIAWYEQKAVLVLLALLHLGVKNIHIGPTIPAFLSENVLKKLVEDFGLNTITNVEDDINKFFNHYHSDDYSSCTHDYSN